MRNIQAIDKGKQDSTWNTLDLDILCNEKYMGIDKYERYSNIYKSVEGCHHKAINTYIDLCSFHTYQVTK